MSDTHAHSELDRREFLKRSALGAAGAAALLHGGGSVAEAATATPLDLAEWSYFWLGVKPAKLAKGTVVNGEQMYVEYFAPAQVRHPFAIVCVHGGGGQGLDWLATPDGRPGWAHYFVQEGYRVYVVDRPGHGRSPFHPDLHGAFPARAATYDQVARQFTAPEKAAMPYGPEALRHNQWPGTGVLGDPITDQTIAGQGGSFLPDLERTHRVWAERAGELLDKIGPAVVMTHSAGGPFAWIAANARPNLVVGLLPVEPAGPTFGNLKWGITASPLVYDPPASDPAELKTTKVEPKEQGRSAYTLQAEPARTLKHLQGIPIGLTTSPASYHWPYDQGTVAYLRQAGCSVTHIELEKIGVTGNAHFMMMEKNNREVLQPILDFLEKTVTPYATAHVRSVRLPPSPKPRRTGQADSTAMKLADIGHFWVGVERKQVQYGVIAGAPMYVQYLIPSEIRHQLPIVLVHGGSGQMLHYMGAGDGASGWAHYYVQAGYKVYLVDRAGHGRCVYHPDALGAINAQPTYEQILPDFQRSARGPNKQWPGTGEMGDRLADQFMASQNATPRDTELARRLWASHGAALLDRIGPAVIQTHSAGGPFGWVVANERPSLVKAVMCFEGAGAPLTDGTLTNLRGVPILYVTAENSTRVQGPAIVDAANKAGAIAEHVYLKDRGLRGNGHFAMFENNRRQVFELFRHWAEQTVKA
ncbi:MAG TPA: alpha/beta fold hydrolase [Vicinamibacterales bacterium]|nr:alpha/beta fold hydrolase [Vicinamibacterales bacterium]